MSFLSFGEFSGSPPKRPSNAVSPPAIPFCTSPSQLQEVTLEHDGTFSNTMGLRSPSGPMRGRSIKEFEEQLTNLKKENFNLKLRIYFLEEKMGTNFTLDKDNIVKKYIELQVDYANLKKEMEEKQELLCQAVKAIELEDEEHKKYVTDKEDQLNMCQQEIEDLRIQLQDIKYDSEAASVKSDTTGFFSSKATSNSVSNELHQRIKMLEQELHLEKENNASLQFVIGQTESLKTRCENMQKEIQAKDGIIQNLQEENELLSARMTSNVMQMKELQEKLDVSSRECQTAHKKMLSDAKKLEELACQYGELKKKYSCVKSELDREHKKSERVKINSDSKVTELEEENEKLKSKLRELQAKLDAALSEIRKNQNLAVSKSPTLKPNKSHTDVPSVSVQDAATPTGVAEKDALHVPVTPSSVSLRSSSSTSISPSAVATPEKYNLDFEELLRSSNNDKIISVFRSLKQDYDTQKQKLFRLKAEQFKACEIIKTMIDSRNKANEEISQYQMQIKNLEKELESVVSKPTSDGDVAPPRVFKANTEKSMEESKTEDIEVGELYKALSVELEAKIEILEATLKEKDNHIQKIREQYDDVLTTLEEREHQITELESEVFASNPDSKMERSSVEKVDSASEKRSSFYKQELEQKDKEIDRLNAELKKCSCYLQEIVNKELWDKNKEIEKLHSRQVNSPEILKLRKDLTGKEHQLKILREKMSELGLDLNILCDAELGDSISPSKIDHIKSLQEELKACKEERDYFREKLKELESADYPETIEKLTAHADSLKMDLEKSENLKRESNKICTLLNCRLEELTVFLDSLLKQKSILGYIGMQKERKLREIINSSLDLSKSFNMSLVFNPDQSLAQLSNITSILNGSAFKDLSLMDRQEVEESSSEMLSIIPGDITLTYQSHLYRQTKKAEPNSEEVISALREQIVNLKSELQLRDNELNRLNANGKMSDTDEETRNHNLSGYVRELSKYVTPTKSNTTSTTLKYQSDCHSESEGWSEPDRAVSRARIGLSQTLPLPTTAVPLKASRLNESTEEDSACSITPKLKLFYEKQQVSELQQLVHDLRAECEKKTEQLKSTVTKEAFEQMKNTLQQTERKLNEIESLKSEMENQIGVYKQEIFVLKHEVEQLTKAKEELKQNLVEKDKEVQNLINQLEVEKTAKIKLSFELEQAIEKANADLAEYECKEKTFKQLESKLRKDMDDFAVNVETQHAKQLEEVELKAAEKICRIKDDCANDYIQRMKELEDDYSRNYVKKSEAEQKLAQVDKLVEELETLKQTVNSYEETVLQYKQKEYEIRVNLVEHQEQNKHLRRERDVVTLQYSESVLEKTKLANEKNLLEQELSRYLVKEMELKQQLAEIRAELESLSQNYQSQLSSLHRQKSELQVKISVLESTNAELHNRFVRSQANRVELSATMPNLSSTSNIKFQQGIGFHRQLSHPSYSSEDNLEECSGYDLNGTLPRNNQPADEERHEANASPDLGIESDQGRFSSLELHQSTTPRPLVQTLELSESMNDLLVEDNNNHSEIVRSEEKQSCCQHTMELVTENNDLKRNLIRMRRALEETAKQLNLANQRKRQVEKTICKQIHKTSQVLRQAKANLDSGSESDALKM